jgi:hypothetical protein
MQELCCLLVECSINNECDADIDTCPCAPYSHVASTYVTWREYNPCRKYGPFPTTLALSVLSRNSSTDRWSIAEQCLLLNVNLATGELREKGASNFQNVSNVLLHSISSKCVSLLQLKWKGNFFTFI